MNSCVAFGAFGIFNDERLIELAALVKFETVSQSKIGLRHRLSGHASLQIAENLDVRRPQQWAAPLGALKEF